MESKVDFTKSLIHELKTPVTSLMATSQLICEEIQGRRSCKLAGYVRGNACRMNSGINELHDMIKSEICRVELELERLDLEEFLSLIVEETQTVAL